MKKQTGYFFRWVVLIVIILMAIPTFFNSVNTILTKGFFESEQFERELQQTYSGLTRSELNPIEIEEIREQITVSASEIDEHRYRYGSLSEQTENITQQYVSDIEEAKENGNKKRQQLLEKERDEKIIDIEENFKNDDHVREKIIQEKIQLIKKLRNDSLQYTGTDIPLAYRLTDVSTGEVYAQGNVEEQAVYQEVFEEGHYFIATASFGEDSSYYEDQTRVDIRELNIKPRQFEGVITIPKKAFEKSPLKLLKDEYQLSKIRNFTLWITGLVALVLALTKWKLHPEWVMRTTVYQRIQPVKIDIKVMMFLFSLFMLIDVFLPAATYWFYSQSSNRALLFEHFVVLLALIVIIMWLTIQLVDFSERWRKEGQLQIDITQSYAAQFFSAVKEMFLNKRLGTQQLILLFGFFFAGLGFAVIGIEPSFFIIYAFFMFTIGLPFLFMYITRSAYLNQVIEATKQMAEGTLHEPIKVKGKSPIAEHAAHLNDLREGVKHSMSEQAKSERLKTELITNVSHDLRTPLTSIITYTDLLKSNDLSKEDRLKYAEIVDKKAARLKTLIEDLFEVSKMASGNLELHRQKLDLAQLLQQSLAEHENDDEHRQLDFRVTLPNEPLFVYVDGQKWWRVFDNLIVNVYKYALANTRVFVSLEQQGAQAIFTIKNISEHPLNEHGDELFERFKRGDDSRHTDGSGLGLAIAQSIVDMHQAEMKIEVDGDLFKVIIEIPVMKV